MASKEPFPRVCFVVGSEQEETVVRALERSANLHPTVSAFFADIVRVADARTDNDFETQVLQRAWSWRTSVVVTTSGGGAGRSAPGSSVHGEQEQVRGDDADDVAADCTSFSSSSSLSSEVETGRMPEAGRRPSWLDNELSLRIAKQIPARLRKKWLHFTLRELEDFAANQDEGPQRFAQILHHCYLTFAADRSLSRPRASVFTTAFHSGARILRVYESLRRQTEQDWEWVILDDSRDDDTFTDVLRDISARDVRIRVFRRDFPSGCIGRAKSEAAALCEGEVLVEVDHDDRLMPDALDQLCTALLVRFPSAGFAYMNYAEVHEGDESNFRYPDGFALGYGYYRLADRREPGALRSETEHGADRSAPGADAQAEHGKEEEEEALSSVSNATCEAGTARRAEADRRSYAMANTPDVNDRSVTHIVGVPNHPRAWRREVLLGALGNYSPMLPVADDYELLLHTVAKTPMVKIDRLGYVQFRNEGGNNFTFLKNAEITRLQAHISRVVRAGKYDMDARFRAAGIHERDGIEHRRINFLTSDALRGGESGNAQDAPHLFVPWSKVFGDDLS